MACALILGLGGVNAKIRNAEFGTPADNGTWNAETQLYEWKAAWSNLMTIFDCNVDKLSNYTSLHLTTENYTDVYRVCFMKGGTALATIPFYSDGQKELNFAERVETQNIDLKEVTHIAFGGSSERGSITLKNVYLEGPDRPSEIKIVTSTGVDMKSLSGTNANWSNTVVYPTSFQSQGSFWGDGDGGKESTHVEMTGYNKLSFNVSQGSDKGLGLRAWIWDGSKVVTLFAHPDADYSTADFSQLYEIREPGVYSVNVDGYTMLKGVKAANKWEGQTPLVVDYAWLSNGEPAYAIDEALTLSSDYPLDFSTVTDVDAYIATGIAYNKVIMKKVTGTVPANTGLVLIQKNDKAVISIPTCGEATEDVSGNLLVATTTQTEVPVGAYVLAGSEQSLGWYSVVDNIPTLPAGKCYLKAPQAGVKSLVMSFDEETTGIAEAEVQREDAVYHNLQGMRVSKPTTGIFITRGKKVIINK